MIIRWSRESWIELRRHRLRTFLTAVGVAIAVTAFTLIAQVGDLARRSLSEELAGFEGLAGTVQVSVQVPPGVGAETRSEVRDMVIDRLHRFEASRIATATSAGPIRLGTDAEPTPAKSWEERCGRATAGGAAATATRSGVKAFSKEEAFEILQDGGEFERPPCEVEAFGAGEGLAEIMAAPMVAGRWLAPSDDRTLGVAAVLSEELAKALVDVEHPTPASLVGSTLHPEGGGQALIVVGVLAENAITRQMSFPGTVFVAPAVAERLASAARAVATADGASGAGVGGPGLRVYALVSPGDADGIARTVASETTQFLQRQGMPDGGASGNRVDNAGQLEKALRILNAVLLGIATVTMVVGALFVLIIALTSLRQRVQELGVRRAVGARPGDLAALLLLESTLVSLVGGVAGVGGAWLISKAVVAFTSIEESVEITSPPLQPLLLGMVVAAGTGVLAGVVPAWRAARLSVLDALRR